ncbi:YveK family protein [Adhaeribacter rhizoryzae]|uniref:Uncharacterized protein n=1 Tax=Adhaeribacter rhizoryzae TaxID=2607907 RepID=A0A5M6DEB6_9BACT|nr:hypothetical protein [Adhaeribacter rhizoryzae]KAA5544756.1 hypothetical protein F0145_13795 [Adhaeribacter rhizoryzae]
MELEKKRRPSEENDTIDLKELFNSFFRLIRNFFYLILKFFFLFFETAAKNLKLIVALTLLGGVLGAAYFYIIRPYYESRMTLGSVYYKGEFINNSIQNLDALAGEGNYTALSRILNIPVKKSSQLKSLKIEPVVSPNKQLLIDLYKETEGNKHRLDSILLNTEDSTFHIKVQVYDTTALNGLDSSLVNFLKQNKYVKKRIEIERANLRSRRAKLIKESGSLDTLKRNIALSYRNQAGGRTGTNNVILDDKGTNPVEIYREDLRLYEQLMDIEKLLYINAEIEIIEPFTALGKPISGTLLKNTILGLLLGLAVAFSVILIKIVTRGLIYLRSQFEAERN